MSGFRRIVLMLATAAAGGGIAGLHAQTALVDPRDSRQIFATACSTCHKSPQGLAKSGQVAGFLRKHYTTGPEMSAAMAAYLVAAGSAPAAKKGENPAARTKGKNQEQVSAQPGADPSAAAKARTLRGKQRAEKQLEANQPEEPARPSPLPAVGPVAPEPIRQAAAPDAASTASSEVPTPPAAPAEPAPPPLVTFDLPLPPMPDAPPADLTQSVFSSSPVP